MNYQEEDIVIEYYNNGKLESSAEAAKIDSVKLLEKSHLAAMNMVIRTEKAHVLYGITIYDENDNIIKQMLFRNTCLSDAQLYNYVSKYPTATPISSSFSYKPIANLQPTVPL